MIGQGRPQAGLARVTLVAIDCLNPLHALRALDICLDKMAFADAVFLSDTASNYNLPGCRMVGIPRIDSSAAYSRFVIKDLGRHVQTSHLLLVQWDGYIRIPSTGTQSWPGGGRLRRRPGHCRWLVPPDQSRSGRRQALSKGPARRRRRVPGRSRPGAGNSR